MERSYFSAHQDVGALLTNHIISDIDMEIELLKHKRLIIEQQQQMLSNKIYDEQLYHRSQPEYDQYENYSRNFSHLYDDGLRSGNNSQFEQNYQSVGLNWELTPSNPYVLQSTENYSFSYRPISPIYAYNNIINRESFNHAQILKPYVPPSKRPNKSGAVQNVKKGFNPTKVTKPKNKTSSNAPNNLNKQPVNNRKALLAKAAPSKEDYILWFDQKLTSKVEGYMESAMGLLLKEFCARRPFADPKEVKKELRVRLRKVLLGKFVTNQQEIIDIYRSEFPAETDESLLQNLSVKFLPEEDPETFFRTYFSKVFAKHVDKLLKRLANIARQESNKTEDDLIADLPDIFVRTKGVSLADVKVEENSGVNDEVESNVDQVKDKDELTYNESAIEYSEQTQPEVVKVQENTSENEPADKQVNGAGDAVTENSNVSKQVVNSDSSVAKIRLNRQEKVKFYTELTDKLINQRLHNLILKRKEDFRNILEMDTSYRTSRGGVFLEFNKLADSLNKLPPHLFSVPDDNNRESVKIENGENCKTTAPKAEIAPTVPKAMYNVKVVGKPSLPDKKRMKAFIYTFNPISIKKHKHIDNLLVIGFASEADMERILIANGTTIDDKKLVITASDKIHGKQNKTNDNDSSLNISSDLENCDKIHGTQNKTNENDSSLNISSDLENAITQLLLDIHNSEEGNSSVKEEPTYDQDGDVVMTVVKTENIEEVADDNVKTSWTDLKINHIKQEFDADVTLTLELAPAKKKQLKLLKKAMLR